MLRFKNYKLVLVFVVTLLVVGCIGPLKPQILLSIPGPIMVSFEDAQVTIETNFETKGIGVLKLNSLEAKFNDEADEEIWSETQAIEKTIPVVPFVSHTENFTVQLPDSLQYGDLDSYNENLKGKKYKLTILVISDTDSVFEEVEIQFI